MSDATADRADLVRSLTIWAASLVAAIIVTWIVASLLGRGTAPGLVFGAAVFLILPYVVTRREARSAPTPGHGHSHGYDQGHGHGHGPEHGHAVAAATVAPAPVPPAPAPVVAPVEAVSDPQPAARLADLGGAVDAPGEPFSERVREAARAAGEAARALAGDGDAGTGTKPLTLAEPRGGEADDLKRLKGVGPKYEGMLHDLGIWHFDQIAGWGPAEIAWIDANLDGFAGRVVREDWVGQAAILAAGGETEHSQRVDRGETT